MGSWRGLGNLGVLGPRVVALMVMVMVGHSDVSLCELWSLARQVGPEVLQEKRASCQVLQLSKKASLRPSLIN